MNKLSAMTWREAARLSDRPTLLLVPFGSTEQHGPHLPLSTDTDIAGALASAAADRLGNAMIAPAVAYGASGEHQGFPGTISIGQAATELVVVELGRSASADFAGIVVVSTHGGNTGPVERAVTTLRHEGRNVWAWGPRWDGDAHAGRTETSLMLAIAPDRVHLDVAEPGDTRPISELLPRLRADGVRSVSTSGVLGDPTGAGADEGRLLLAAAVDDLVAFAQGHRARAHLGPTAGMTGVR